MGSRFSGSGIGHVVNGLNEQGGLYASLKSRIVVPSCLKSEYRKRAASYVSLPLDASLNTK